MYRPPPSCQTKAKVRELSSNGVMDECSGEVQKADTHAGSFIVMYLAVVEIHHSAAALNVKASALPNKEGRDISGQLHPTGCWKHVLGRLRKRELTP